jgi:hypothetical protein
LPQASRDLGEGPALWREGRPVPPLQPGQARAGDMVGKYIKCNCGDAGCNGVARVAASQAEGSYVNKRFVRTVCSGMPRNLDVMEPVTPADAPAVEPDPRPLYQRPVTINPRRT